MKKLALLLVLIGVMLTAKAQLTGSAYTQLDRTTNAWLNGPSGAIDMRFGRQTYAMSADVTITGLNFYTGTNVSLVIAKYVNRSGSDRSFTWTGFTTNNVTNGWKLEIAIECDPSVPETNIITRLYQ